MDPREDLKGFLDEVSKYLPMLVGDDPLDEYFTRKVLRDVPEIVARLRRLPDFHVGVIPGGEVVGYFQQACTCYLNLAPKRIHCTPAPN